MKITLLLPAFLLLISIGCTKSEVYLPEMDVNTFSKTSINKSPVSTNYGGDTINNLRLVVQNLDNKPMFAHIAIFPAGQLGANPLYVKDINTGETGEIPTTTVFFSLPYGVSYQVAVTNTYGEVSYGPPYTASFQQVFTLITMNGPEVIAPTTPPTPPPTPEPEIVEGAYNFIVQVIHNTVRPAAIRITDNSGNTTLKEKALIGINTTARFDLPYGTSFRVIVIYDDGSTNISQDYLASMWATAIITR